MSEAPATSPLRHSELRRIVAGYTVNRLGTWFGFIALAVVVFDHTRSTLAVASLLLASQVLPALIVPALVARIEKSTRRGELSRLYLFEAVTTSGLIALVLWQFSLPAILLLLALDGTAALTASSLLRAAAARSARDWVRQRLRRRPRSAWLRRAWTTWGRRRPTLRARRAMAARWTSCRRPPNAEPMPP
jgi:hypothetical protein